MIKKIIIISLFLFFSCSSDETNIKVKNQTNTGTIKASLNKNTEINKKLNKKNLIYNESKKIYDRITKAIKEGKKWENIFNEIKNIERNKRKIICIKLMNENRKTNPKLAFKSANCLLYNGYGKLAIPIFAEYLYGEENKKYFNGRIGYGWMHSSDWYNVGNEILLEMTNGNDLTTWINSKILDEVLNNIEKYKKINPDIFQIIMKYESRKITKSLKFSSLTKEQEKEFGKKQSDCPNLVINLSGISCELNRSQEYINCFKNIDSITEKCSNILNEKPKFTNCKKLILKGKEVSILCKKNGTEEIIFEY